MASSKSRFDHRQHAHIVHDMNNFSPLTTHREHESHPFQPDTTSNPPPPTLSPHPPVAVLVPSGTPPSRQTAIDQHSPNTALRGHLTTSSLSVETLHSRRLRSNSGTGVMLGLRSPSLTNLTLGHLGSAGSSPRNPYTVSTTFALQEAATQLLIQQDQQAQQHKLLQQQVGT